MSALFNAPDPELVGVLESHAVVAAFWMREYTEAQGLNDHLVQQLSDLQEATRPDAEDTAVAELKTMKTALRDYRKIENVLTEKLEHAEGLCVKLREERNEAEQKALISLEALNDESAQHRETAKKLEDAETELSQTKEALANSRAEADVFAQEINKQPGPSGVFAPLVVSPNGLELELETLRGVLREVKMHVHRADVNFSDDPDMSLRSLDSAKKLLAQASTS